METNIDLKRKAASFSTKKQLGQNFLINREILEKIADQLNIQKGERVLEIGPGLGFLTESLAKREAQITCVELDSSCIAELKKLSLANLQIIEDDFLKLDLSKIIDRPIKVIGNIPYNITSPIIAKLLGEIGQPSPWLGNIRSIVLTVQKELADRLVAVPGNKDFSQITLLMNYFGETEMLFTIGRENFSPPPQIESAVVRFVPHKEPPIKCKNHILLRRVIQASFAKRRKMLKNNLCSLHIEEKMVEDIFQELNFDPYVRAEYVSLEKFAKLTNAIDNMLTSHGHAKSKESTAGAGEEK